MDIKTFNRVEKKYLINTDQKSNLLKHITEHMKRDEYFRSEVYNIYFDTDNYDFIIRSIERPKFKEKLRARSYGGYDKVFLEIKTKMKNKDLNYGFKRRVLITNRDYNNLVGGRIGLKELAAKKIETPHDLQIASEVEYFINQFDLKPRILVHYSRTSYVGEDKLRITFDENLKYRDTNLKFKNDRKDKKYFHDKKDIIMEIKAHGVIPLWLAKALSKSKAYPQQFSKIGKVYEQLNKERINNV